MPENNQNPQQDNPAYVKRSSTVLQYELDNYIVKRRAANGLEAPTPDDLKGLCISGGGVRSATLGLGMLQEFVRAKILPRIDYLCTVSGGGYIGSCLSSLLSDEPEYVDKGGQIKNDNQRFHGAMAGLDEENSPFNKLNKQYEYNDLQTTVFSAKHQLHHLRRHGEYLTPNKSLFGWHVNRAIGALLSGGVINFITFILILSTFSALHHVFFAAMSNGEFISILREPSMAFPGQYIRSMEDFSPEIWSKMSTMEQLRTWWNNKLDPQFNLVINAVIAHKWVDVAFLLLGAFFGLYFINRSRRLPDLIARGEQEEQKARPKDGSKVPIERAGGADLLAHFSQKIISRFNFVCYGLAPLLAYATVIILHQVGHLKDYEYYVILGLPLMFSVGIFLSVTLGVSLWYINNAPERFSGRLYRSYYNGMQGATMLGLATSLVFPLALIIVLGRNGLALKLLVSYVPVAAAYYFTMSTLGGGKSEGGIMSTIVQKLQMPLLNLSIFLFVGIAISLGSNWVYDTAAWVDSFSGMGIGFTAFIMFIFLLLVTVWLGFAANSNDLSLHYFYRDRLSEAYLRTQGRVARPKDPEDGATYHVQPKELFDVNLRNHENLRLKDLGEGNFKGPYHIIISALNLQGSHDLAKKTIRSDHFIFSKYFVGSRTTGYYRTDAYRGGDTKLSTAMTISAAAVASGMGLLSFAASNFYMTLFNLRTGYWIENPWYLQKENVEESWEKDGKKVQRSLMEKLTKRLRRSPFWLYYLWCEFTGKLSADTRRVYVSDGGHTGDNLGMLPLVQRRCSTIIVADFEEDGKFSFGSFSQAVRLAKTIYDADIEIDLRPLMPEKKDGDIIVSPRSVVHGTITYADGKKGELIYMKSSVSLAMKEAARQEKNAPPPPMTEPAPVFVLNYFKNNPTFPHQSTADQYFDEIQFEAYRMLGEHIARQAVPMVSFK